MGRERGERVNMTAELAKFNQHPSSEGEGECEPAGQTDRDRVISLTTKMDQGTERGEQERRVTSCESAGVMAGM